MTFGIIGGDRRYGELARLLERDGHTVLTCRIGGEGIQGTVSEERDALEKTLSADTVILPLPLCREAGYLNCAGKPLAMQDVLDLLTPPAKKEPEEETPAKQGPGLSGNSEPCAEPENHAPASRRLALAGMVPAGVQQEAERRGIRLVDYFQLETLAVANAAATADAALCLTVQHTGQTLLGKRCLVLGFGRIGKLLCLRLRGLGASVTAAARKGADRAWIRAMGFEALDLHALPGRLALPGRVTGRGAQTEPLDDFDVVYNTVPAPVLDQASLERLAGGVSRAAVPEEGETDISRNASAPVLVELASRPGFDADAARRLGLRVLPAPGLPGRLVPSTAAGALRDAVYELLTEESAARGTGAVYTSGI